MKRISIVTRSFQAGTGGKGKEFDQKYFCEKVARPIERLISLNCVERIVVVVNGDQSSPLSENYIGKGETPTTRALKQVFPTEIEESRLAVIICTEWGNNPGSGEALNDGIKFISKESRSDSLVMCWSPEIEMTGDLISKAIDFMEERDLSVVGFVRQGWWEKPQWNVVQNTAAIWELCFLNKIHGFSKECNGDGRTLFISEFGEVPVAGMEDFHAMLRAFKECPFEWGMVGKGDPLQWDVNFPVGSQREKNHLIKVARQYAVMKTYVNDVFPELTFEKVMGNLFRHYHLD